MSADEREGREQVDGGDGAEEERQHEFFHSLNR
jgi:hypothetical protein